MTGFIEFWTKYLSIILLTIFFTFIGVLGRYLRTIQKRRLKFSFKSLIVEFIITLSITIFIALVCIEQSINTLTMCIAVGLGGHFGTSGTISILCKYLKLDCKDILPQEERIEEKEDKNA